MLSVAVVSSEADAGLHHIHSSENECQCRERLRRRAKAQGKLRANIGGKMWRLLQEGDQNFRRFLEWCAIISQDWYCGRGTLCVSGNCVGFP